MKSSPPNLLEVRNFENNTSQEFMTLIDDIKGEASKTTFRQKGFKLLDPNTKENHVELYLQGKKLPDRGLTSFGPFIEAKLGEYIGNGNGQDLQDRAVPNTFRDPSTKEYYKTEHPSFQRLRLVEEYKGKIKNGEETSEEKYNPIKEVIADCLTKTQDLVDSSKKSENPDKIFWDTLNEIQTKKDREKQQLKDEASPKNFKKHRSFTDKVLEIAGLNNCVGRR